MRLRVVPELIVMNVSCGEPLSCFLSITDLIMAQNAFDRRFFL